MRVSSGGGPVFADPTRTRESPDVTAFTVAVPDAILIDYESVRIVFCHVSERLILCVYTMLCKMHRRQMTWIFMLIPNRS